MVSCMQIMDTLILNVFQMQIEQVPKWIEDPHQAIVFSLEEIWSHRKVRNKMLCHDRVQNQNIVLTVCEII